MAIDAGKTAGSIIKLVGGPGNIVSVTHCATRLRFVLVDTSKAQTEELKKVKGVLGALYAMEQYQVVLGANLLPVYEEVVKRNNLKETEVVKENLDQEKSKNVLTLGGIGSTILGFVAASVNPMIPGLIAGGMMKVLLLLITMVWAGFADTQTYLMLSIVANVPFYYMPIFVAFGAAKKLGGTPMYAMAAAASLVAPDFLALVSEGNPVTMFGISVLLKNYSSSLLPALLIGLAAYWLEKFWNKVVPGIFKSIFVGMMTIICTSALGYVILAPIGTYVGNYIVAFLVFLQSTIGPFALAVLSAALPFLIMTGMHTLFGPFMVQSIADVGYDGFFRPALILHNMAEGGACFGVALRTKDAELRSEAVSIGVGCIFAGVTEPAIYGITVRYRKPLYGVVAGGAAGGLIAGLMGAKAFVMGYSTVLALPIFESTMLAMSVGIVVAIVVSLIITAIVGIDENLL